MDWTVIALVLILFALWNIGTQLANLIKTLHAKEMTANNNNSVNMDTSGIEQQLKRIITLMGGDEKIQQKEEQKRKSLRERVIEALIKEGNAKEKAKNIADDLFEEMEFAEAHDTHATKTKFDETHNVYQTFENIQKWVNGVEIDERYYKKFGHYLSGAREVLKGEENIDPSNLSRKIREQVLKTNVSGTPEEKWLVGKLVDENRLKPVTEYNEERNRYDVTNYEAIKS